MDVVIIATVKFAIFFFVLCWMLWKGYLSKKNVTAFFLVIPVAAACGAALMTIFPQLPRDIGPEWYPFPFSFIVYDACALAIFAVLRRLQKLPLFSWDGIATFIAITTGWFLYYLTFLSVIVTIATILPNSL